MIGLLVYIFVSLLINFLLTLQQIHFVIVANSKTENEHVNSVRESIINGFYRKPKQFLEATALAKLFFFAIFIVASFHLLSTQTLLFEQTTIEWLIVTAFIFLSSFLYLFCCEFLPRFFYDYTNKHLSIRHLLAPMVFVYVLFYPLAGLFYHIKNLFLRRSSKKNEQEPAALHWDESAFDVYIKEQLDKNTNPEEESEKQIIRNVIDFSSTKVKESMIPRTEIVSVNIENTTVAELKEKFSQSGHARIIVYQDDIDHVVGYIHSLELFKGQNEWKEHIKEIPFVPETMAAHDLMKDLTQKQKNIAVVVDEYGGTVGIITLEDLVEEIFGEIEDEHDKKNFIERKINDKEFIFSGRIEIDYINEQYDFDLPVSEDYLTLGGLLIYVNERFPNLNQVIVVNNISFTILKMSPTKVELVKVVVN